MTGRAADNSLGSKEIVECGGFVSVGGERAFLRFEAGDRRFLVALQNTVDGAPPKLGVMSSAKDLVAGDCNMLLFGRGDGLAR